MVVTVEIPARYKYVIDRVFYELLMRSRNTAFMLHRNLDNPDFLNTELYERLENELIDAYLNRWITLNSIYDTLGIPVDGYLSMNPVTGVYSVSWVKE